MKRRGFLAAATATVLVLAGGAAVAQSLAAQSLAGQSLAGQSLAGQSLAGQTIEFWIPFKEGGGTDVWARVLAPRIGDALPGGPKVIVRNIPGGGIGGTNEWQRRMQPDGSMIFGTSGSVQIPFLLKDPRVRYDYASWAPLFATPAGGVVYVSTNMGVDNIVEDFQDLKSQRLRYGSQGVATLDLVPLLAFELLGLDVEAIFGFASRSIARQSIQRDEVTIDYQTTPSFLKHVAPLVDDGTMVPLFSWGALQADGSIGRDPTFPDMPSFPEVYEAIKGEPPAGPGWEAWKSFFTAGFGAQKFVVLPADTAQETVESFRNALADMAADAEVREALKAQIGVYQPITGDAVVTAMQAATQVNPEAEAWVLAWLKDRFNFKQ